MARKLKLPNSYGCVAKMGNASRRRRPYIVRVTEGYEFDEEKIKTVQKYRIIGYAKTREEGLQMLARFHDHPYDLSRGRLTFREIYELWSEEKFEDASNSTIAGYRAAYGACTSIYERYFVDLKTKDLQNVIDTCGRNYPTLKKIKIMFSQMYNYALREELCGKDYSKFVDISKMVDKNPNKRERDKFNNSEIDMLWSMKSDKYYQIILMLIYTGVRISELLDLKKEDINFDEHYFNVIKSKTQSGIRKVPISDYIYPFFVNWNNISNSDYLLSNETNKHFKYRNYYDSYYLPLIEPLGIDHTPHCYRHTLISLLAEAEVLPTYIKMIAGHKSNMSMTEKTYTHIDMRILIEQVNKVYYPKSVKQ